MRRFILNISLFLALNVLFGIFYLMVTQMSYSYKMGDTSSVLLAIPKDETFDLVLLGTSHAQNFSVGGGGFMHAKVEEMLQRRMLNLSKTNAGFDEERFFLTHFYNEGNTTDTVLYLLDPFIFFSHAWDIENHFLNDEPLYPDALWEALSQKIDREVIIDYVRSKFIGWWLLSRRPVEKPKEEPTKTLLAIDERAVEKRLAYLYPNGLDRDAFAHYEESLRELITLASAHGSNIVFAYPPSLLGVLPGSGEVSRIVKRAQKEFPSVSFFDFSSAFLDPRLYIDHDHLSSNGILLFISRYLKPALDRI